MVYISSDGVVDGGRSPWKLSSILAFFMGIINMMFLFLKTLMQPDLTSRGTGYSSNYRSGGGQLPPGPPRRRMGGFGDSHDSSSAPMGGCGCR